MDIQDAHVLPTLLPDIVPAVGILRELAPVGLVYTAVVLGTDAPPGVGEIEFGHRLPVGVTQNPIDLGLGQARTRQRQAQPCLARRTHAASHLDKCATKDASPHVAHHLDLIAQLLQGGQRPRAREQVVRGSNEVIERPERPDLAPGTRGGLDGKAATTQDHRRLPRLKTMTDHAGDAGFATRAMCGHVQARAVGPIRHRRTHRLERGFVAEELPACEPRRILRGDLERRRRKGQRPRRSEPTMRRPKVAAGEPCGADAHHPRLGHPEHRRKIAGKRRGSSHPTSVPECEPRPDRLLPRRGPLFDRARLWRMHPRVRRPGTPAARAGRACPTFHRCARRSAMRPVRRSEPAQPKSAAASS